MLFVQCLCAFHFITFRYSYMSITVRLSDSICWNFISFLQWIFQDKQKGVSLSKALRVQVQRNQKGNKFHNQQSHSSVLGLNYSFSGLIIVHIWNRGTIKLIPSHQRTNWSVAIAFVPLWRTLPWNFIECITMGCLADRIDHTWNQVQLEFFITQTYQSKNVVWAEQNNRAWKVDSI